MRLTIGAKLLFILIAIGLFASLFTGWMDSRQAQKSIQDASFARLIAIREARKEQIETYFKRIHNQASSMAENLMVIQALEDFSDRL